MEITGEMSMDYTCWKTIGTEWECQCKGLLCMAFTLTEPSFECGDCGARFATMAQAEQCHGNMEFKTLHRGYCGALPK